jgi:NAD+-dependent secondary alcohol dehydrogenase Adh1
VRAARLHAFGEPLRFDDVPPPEVRGPHDLVVRVGGAGVCRTDLHLIEGGMRGRVDPVLPLVPGHENAGWVEAVGGSVTAVRPGQAVIVHPLVTCGTCLPCRRGEDMHCEGSAFPGLNADGGFAELLLTNDRAVLPIGEGMEPRAVAPLADAGLAAYRAARRAAALLPPGTRCALIGIGGLGHVALQCLRALCAAELIAVDVSSDALELARRFGADRLVEGGDGVAERVLAATGGRGVEAVLDFVGESGTTEQGPAMLTRAGTYLVVGYGGLVDLPAIDLVGREISVQGSLVGSYAELAELMALAAAGRVRLQTREYALEDVNVALDDLRAGRIHGRAVLVP